MWWLQGIQISSKAVNNLMAMKETRPQFVLRHSGIIGAYKLKSTITDEYAEVMTPLCMNEKFVRPPHYVPRSPPPPEGSRSTLPRTGSKPGSKAGSQAGSRADLAGTGSAAQMVTGSKTEVAAGSKTSVAAGSKSEVGGGSKTEVAAGSKTQVVPGSRISLKGSQTEIPAAIAEEAEGTRTNLPPTSEGVEPGAEGVEPGAEGAEPVAVKSRSRASLKKSSKTSIRSGSKSKMTSSQNMLAEGGAPVSAKASQAEAEVGGGEGEAEAT